MNTIKIKSIILKAVFVLTFSQFMVVTSEAQAFEVEKLPAKELEMVQVPPKPKINNFRITDRSTENSIFLLWDKLSLITEYKLYRTISLLMALPVQNNSFFSTHIPKADNFQSYGGRKLIKVLNIAHGFSDRDISPLNIENPSRSLGQRYCYTLEAWKNDQIYAESKKVCTDRRGINSAVNVKGIETSTPYNSFRITWEDRASFEDGFYLDVYRTDKNPSLRRKIKVVGKNKESFLLKNLLPDTNYYVGVTAYDFYGESGENGINIKTSKSPEITPEPEIKTFTLTLSRQEIVEGMIPYFGRFSISNGRLEKVKLLSQWPTLYFVKSGFNTSQCNQSNAVVVLNPSSELSSSQMQTLFGSIKPSSPIDFVACAQATQTLLNWIPIKLFYTKD